MKQSFILLLTLCYLCVEAQEKLEGKSAPYKEIFQDTLKNAISLEAFNEKLKSGKYEKIMQIENGIITHILMSKSKNDKMKGISSGPEKTLLNISLPDFQLKKMDGTEISSSSLKGKIVVMNFWFIACPPCIEEMPLLNKVVSHYSNRSEIVFLAPAFDEMAPLSKFLTKHAFSYQVLASSLELHRKMEISSYPTNIIVDADGVIKEVITGGRKDIDKLLIQAIDKIGAK